MQMLYDTDHVENSSAFSLSSRRKGFTLKDNVGGGEAREDFLDLFYIQDTPEKLASFSVALPRQMSPD
jgi:hypothetical protein